MSTTRAPRAPGARQRTDPAPPTARFPWREVLVPWLVSRVLAAAAITGAASWPFSSGLKTGGFRLWDGAWYTVIAQFGYGEPPVGDEATRWPFFPLVSGVIRAFSEIGIDGQVATILLGQVAVLVALAGIHRLAARRSTPGATRLAIWTCALFPGSFVLTMLYPSAFFLAATVWAFVFVDEHADLAAGACAAVATVARPNGALIVLALAVAVRVPRRILLTCGPALAALAAWMVYLWDRTGDPLVFWNTKDSWPEVSLIDFVQEPWNFDSPAAHLALGAVALLAVWLCRRSLPTSWLVWTGLVLLPPLAVGLVGMGRYATECFPVFIAAGQVVDRWRPRTQRALLVLGAVGMVVLAVMVVRYDRVP